MPIEDATYSTLQNIIRKVRRITSSPSPLQITDADIQHYINIYVLYNFPEDIKLFNLKKTITFYTNPNVQEYTTNLTDPNEPLYNFKNRYSFTGEPCYINGIRSIFTQDRSQFYRQYPQQLYTTTIGSGDGANTIFAGTLTNFPILRNNCIFSSVDNNGNGLQVWDDGNGLLYGDVAAPGNIDYVTGVYNLTFTLAPAAGQDVLSKTVPYNPSTPMAVLFFDESFIVRPVPDGVYAINLEVYARPDELLNAGDMPELSQHWEYIAYGAAKKIFEDRRDMEGRESIMPILKELEDQVRAKSTMQLSNQRSSTIYEDKGYFGSWSFPFGWRN